MACKIITGKKETTGEKHQCHFTINQAENHISNMAVNFRGDFQKAIDILKYCTDLYPQSDQTYAFLAKAYFDQGDFKSDRKYLEKALDINPENKFAQRMKMMFEKRKGEL